MINDIRPCDVTSIRAEFLDCCLPDCFQGSGAEEVLAFPVHSRMTYREAYEAAKDEFDTGSGYFDAVDGCGGLAEEALHALFSVIEDMDAVADFVRYVEDGDEDCESVYAYIALHAESNLD